MGEQSKITLKLIKRPNLGDRYEVIVEDDEIWVGSRIRIEDVGYILNKLGFKMEVKYVEF